MNISDGAPFEIDETKLSRQSACFPFKYTDLLQVVGGEVVEMARPLHSRPPEAWTSPL